MSTDELTVDEGVPPSRPHDHAPTLPRVSTFAAALRSEWTKLRSVRSSVWCLILTAAFTVGIGALLCWTWVNRPRRRFRDLFEFDPTAQSMGGVLLAMLSIGVLGTLVMSGEHTTGMIRTTFAAVPRRRVVLAAKALVVAVVSFVVSTVSVFVAFFIGQGILATDGWETGLGEPNVLRALFGASLFLTLIALFGLAIGTVVRRTPGALAAMFGMLLIAPLIIDELPDPWDENIGKFTPLFAATVLSSVRVDRDLLAPGEAMLILIGWVVVWFAAAILLLSTRDA